MKPPDAIQIVHSNTKWKSSTISSLLLSHNPKFMSSKNLKNISTYKFVLFWSLNDTDVLPGMPCNRSYTYLFFFFFFHFYCPVLGSGGGRKTCVQKKWPIHQTPSYHSLNSILKWLKIAQGIFSLTRKQPAHTKTHTHITHISHPSLALKTHPVNHINNKKDNQLKKMTGQDKTRQDIHSIQPTLLEKE